jgi:hypothetical protein
MHRLHLHAGYRIHDKDAAVEHAHAALDLRHIRAPTLRIAHG